MYRENCQCHYWFYVSTMYLSKTKKSKCGYYSKEMLDDYLKQQCKEVQGKAKLVKGQKTLTFSTTQEEPPKKKVKSNNGENLNFSSSLIQVEESANSANISNIQSIKMGNSSKYQSWILNFPMT